MKKTILASVIGLIAISAFTSSKAIADEYYYRYKIASNVSESSNDNSNDNGSGSGSSNGTEPGDSDSDNDGDIKKFNYGFIFGNNEIYNDYYEVISEPRISPDEVVLQEISSKIVITDATGNKKETEYIAIGDNPPFYRHSLTPSEFTGIQKYSLYYDVEVFMKNKYGYTVSESRELKNLREDIVFFITSLSNEEPDYSDLLNKELMLNMNFIDYSRPTYVDEVKIKVSNSNGDSVEFIESYSPSEPFQYTVGENQVSYTYDIGDILLSKEEAGNTICEYDVEIIMERNYESLNATFSEGHKHYRSCEGLE